LGRVERPRRCVRLAHFQEDLLDTTPGEHLEHLLDEGPSQPATPAGWGHRKVQDLAFVDGVERHDVAGDRAGARPLGYQKERVGRYTVAEILRGPRIGEDLLLDRLNRRNVREFSGTNAEVVGRGAPPI